MPRDGSGNYTKPVNSVDPAVPLTTISSTDFNQLTTDLAGEMTDSLDRSGKGAMLAALAMGGFRINNLGAPSVASDAARLDTVTGITLAGDVTGGTGTNAVANVPGGVVTGLAAGAFAGAGKVGQVVTATNVIAATNSISANITSIALSAGNWLLFAGVSTGVGGGTVTTAFNGFIASGTVAGPVVGSSITQSAVSEPSGTPLSFAVPPSVVTIGSPVTYFLNGAAFFSGGSLNLGGTITGVRLG